VSFRRVADVASPLARRDEGHRRRSTKVLLLNVGGDVRAYEDSCPHRGVALSCGKSRGRARDADVRDAPVAVRRAHRQGVNPRGVALRRLPMKVEDDGIWIEVDW
jgi:nitrite reductase/ring-hydroxylating ferredoxin subunit